jgi:hypothetical protein
MERIGFGLYAACVDFLLRVAAAFGITYRDANAGLFFVLWPLVTALLLGIVLRQRVAIRRLRRRLPR